MYAVLKYNILLRPKVHGIVAPLANAILGEYLGIGMVQPRAAAEKNSFCDEFHSIPQKDVYHGTPSIPVPMPIAVA